MNRLAILALIISGLFLSSCKTQQKAITADPDDVYFQPSTAQDFTKPAPTSPQVITTPDTAKTGNLPSSTLSEDLNDYSYSARVKRFSNPTPGSGYYDETYTNPANYDTTVQGSSSSPDVNIYLGTGYDSYWGPSFSVGFGMGWGYYDPWYGWGYPYYGYGYSPWYWYDPWYYPYPYYGYYGYGYWDGYNHGYYDGYYGYPYDGGYYGWDYPYSTDYGHRHNPTGGGEGLGTRTGSGSANPATTLNQREIPANGSAATTSMSRGYSRSEPNQTIASARTSTGSSPVPASQQKYRYTRPSSEKSTSYQRQSTGNQRQTQQTPPKYVRPQQNVTAPASRSATTTRNYSSPAYRQPKSSQEYLSPRTQAPGAERQATQQGYREPNTRTGTSQPSNMNRTSPSGTREYSNPQRNNASPGKSVTPDRSRSSGSYSTPSRSGGSGSYSSPSRSGGGSYSAPSRSSGGSNSAPSRSSGGSSGGSSPRSGGGGGGRR